VRDCISPPASCGRSELTRCEMQSRTTFPAIAAGLLYTFHPGILYLALQGLSEPLFILLVALGLGMILKAAQPKAIGRLLPATKWQRRKSKVEIETTDHRPSAFSFHSSVLLLAGSSALGLACLVRANFVLFPFFLVALIIAAKVVNYGWRIIPGRSELAKHKTFGPLHLLLLSTFCFLLFLTPTAGWIARNYHTCGHPVISTLKGQTLYGGNNEIVANDLNWWGYWVFPDMVPGETPMRELAKTMSEYEVDHYYTQKAVAYMKDNGFSYPRLLLGKVIRAYVPIPWKPSMGSYAISAYRWMIYLLVAIGLLKCSAALHGAKCSARLYLASPTSDHRPLISGICSPISALWLALFLTNAVTILVFWGNARFALSLEPFLLPLAAMTFIHSFSQHASIERET
jgi:hypothetical protein